MNPASSDREAPRDIRAVLALGKAFLERKGIASARLDTELLVAHVLGTDRLHVFLDLDRPVSSSELDAARQLLVRRSKGEPCAYLIGEREFYGRDFRVGPGVLIPRPETELLVDRARELLADVAQPQILDLGTGSGCLALTLALELPGARVLATDLSPKALEFAGQNRELHGLGERVELLQGDGLEPAHARAPFDLIVSNPPYVDRADPAGLEEAVRAFEPEEALFAPAGDPDVWVRRLVEQRGSFGRPGGVILVELGHDQSARLGRWLDEVGEPWSFLADLEGHERVLELRVSGDGAAVPGR